MVHPSYKIIRPVPCLYVTFLFLDYEIGTQYTDSMPFHVVSMRVCTIFFRNILLSKDWILGCNIVFNWIYIIGRTLDKMTDFNCVLQKNAFTDHALGIIGILFLHQNRSRKNTLRINDMVDLGTVTHGKYISWASKV